MLWVAEQSPLNQIGGPPLHFCRFNDLKNYIFLVFSNNNIWAGLISIKLKQLIKLIDGKGADQRLVELF